ncbi:hypothetical protein, partial [Pseudomonas viridiflava]|uniref:hypothetical protein n=1 Tax=Pseudomonas viridiflava TaxID=33069 RepID=UPI001F07A3A3
AKLQRGATIWRGRENLPYKIVKTHRDPPLGQVQGKSAQQAMSVIALLASCAPLAEQLDKAVILEEAAFSSVLRGCGANLRIGTDFKVPRFSCFRGHKPSY